MGDQQGSAEPPADAYGRMSDPTRYAELHTFAASLTQQLVERYDAQLSHLSVPDPAGREPDAPALQVVPSRPDGAVLTLVLTQLPGIEVRLDGRTWLLLPHCGCDACDETTDECLDQLRNLVTATVDGTIGERLTRLDGEWSHERWAQSNAARWSSRTPVTRAWLSELQTAFPGDETAWEAWPRR